MDNEQHIPSKASAGEYVKVYIQMSGRGRVNCKEVSLTELQHFQVGKTWTSSDMSTTFTVVSP